MKHANTLLQQATDLLHSCDEITAVEIHRKQTERAKALHTLRHFRDIDAPVKTVGAF